MKFTQFNISLMATIHRHLYNICKIKNRITTIERITQPCEKFHCYKPYHILAYTSSLCSTVVFRHFAHYSILNSLNSLPPSPARLNYCTSVRVKSEWDRANNVKLYLVLRKLRKVNASPRTQFCTKHTQKTFYYKLYIYIIVFDSIAYINAFRSRRTACVSCNLRAKSVGLADCYINSCSHHQRHLYQNRHCPKRMLYSLRSTVFPDEELFDKEYQPFPLGGGLLQPSSMVGVVAWSKLYHNSWDEL